MASMSILRKSLLASAALLACFSPAQAVIRVITYNIQCSGLGVVPPNPGFDTVIKAIGDHHLAGTAQRVDVLALQELDGVSFFPAGNSATLPYVTSQLNTIYGDDAYIADPVKNPTTGGTGGGPNGLVYNKYTISVVSAKVIGTVSGSGAARAPMRYQLRPVGYGPEADFYLYVSHYKASSGSTNQTRRNIEATSIRQDADALGPAAHIIYSGDFNFTSGRSEPAFQTLVAAGAGKAYDPANPGNTWGNNSTYRALMTESATTCNIRFDFQMVTDAVLNQNGLRYVANSYATFGNNGTSSFGASVNSAFNTALSDLPNSTQVLGLLTTVSDHLPVVADYALVLPAACPADLNGDHAVDDADFVIFAAAYDTLLCPGSPSPCPADLNSDSVVDDSDFVIFAAAYDDFVCP